MQITLCYGLAIGNLISETVESPEKDTAYKVTASIFLAVLSLAPLILGIVLYRKRHQLNEPETKSSIGALYEHYNPLKPYVASYPIVFLLRRGVFVLITFALYKLPFLQA